MTPQELITIGRELYHFGWQTRLAEALNVEGSTVRRWIAGKHPIPGPAETALRLLLEKKRNGT